MNMRFASIAKAVVLVAASVLSLDASAWRIDLNFNGGTIGARAQGPGGFSDAAGNTFYTAAQYYEGGKAVEMNIAQGDTAFGTWGGIITHPTVLRKGDEIWVRVRTFMPAGFNYDSYGEGGHLKFLRVHTQSESGANQGYNDWYIDDKNAPYAHKFIYEGEQVWDNFAGPEYRPVLGQWETYEMYLKLDNIPVSAGGQARVRLWKNGVLIKDITNRKTLATASSVSDRTHLFTYWNGGAPQTQKMYVDDVVVTSDLPAGRDAHGNPYIGVGKAASLARPAAPGLSVQ